MILVNAQEVIAFHDRILQWLPGVAGMPDPGRAEALIYRVQNRAHYDGVTDIFELAATYWVAIARGHIFNDGNKRTAFFVTMTSLYRNGIVKRLNFDYIINMSYSLDFRRKVLAIKKEKGLNIKETAKRFCIGSATVSRWIKQINPKPAASRSRKIDKSA